MTLRASGHLRAMGTVMTGGAFGLVRSAGHFTGSMRLGNVVALLAVEAMTSAVFFNRTVHGGMAYAAMRRGERLRFAGVHLGGWRYRYRRCFSTLRPCRNIAREHQDE